MKQCIKCEEGKDESEFYKEKNNKNGLRNDCKECNKQKGRENYWNNREERIQKKREYCKLHREELNQKGKENYGNNKEEISQKKREYYWDHREEIIQQSREYEYSPLKYNSNSQMRKEIELYEEVRKSSNDNVECKCAYCGDGFEPIKLQIQNRLKAVNGEGTEGAEHKLYCSESCKLSCSIFGKQLYERGYEPTTSNEVQPALRKMVFARDNYICVECGGHKGNLDKLDISLHCHHKEGVQHNPLESADIDKCETRCSVCHKKVHQIPGFTYNDLKCPQIT